MWFFLTPPLQPTEYSLPFVSVECVKDRYFSLSVVTKVFFVSKYIAVLEGFSFVVLFGFFLIFFQPHATRIYYFDFKCL